LTESDVVVEVDNIDSSSSDNRVSKGEEFDADDFSNAVSYDNVDGKDDVDGFVTLDAELVVLMLRLELSFVTAGNCRSGVGSGSHEMSEVDGNPILLLFDGAFEWEMPSVGSMELFDRKNSSIELDLFGSEDDRTIGDGGRLIKDLLLV